ncbi:hypothetical protein DBR32_09010 [Taibaiella sp. KBW10]|uniref:tail fiber domain-containing protein n=1 Tax=Taibaiella sp. KBW10 TaxID=2153357 RepID=UPI000F5B6068|nr:tail fiber domain-containing protein [Taibaiella sp. KBW10]RQO30846.1 hypothetical protein DBR32_09010 [Taibaiella sp. KBW10]
MKTSKHTNQNVFLKTRTLNLAAAGFVTLLALSNTVQAQNSSYNANTVPIGGGQNSAFGQLAMPSTSGTANSAIGYRALNATTSGGYNTAAGGYALAFNVTGNYNSGFGYQALYNNTTDNNTAVGFRSMYINSTGASNVATGYAALYTNSTGSNNVANGFQALYGNTTGVNNSATGYNALYANTYGRDNVANGFNSLTANTSGSYNAAGGSYSMSRNVTGFYNAAFGYQALSNSLSDNNTAIGFRSLYLNGTGANNTASGFAALYNNGAGSDNTGVGYLADVSTSTLSNATVIGSGAVVNASNKVRIGNGAVTVIEGEVPFSSVSDGRFKTNVKEEDVKGLDFIKKLRPVVYNLDTRKLTEFRIKDMPESEREKYLKQDFTAATNVRQSGFIAQEVEKAAKEVNYNFNGVHAPANDNDNYSLAYAEFVVPLVKAVQEQQQIIEKLQQQISDLQETQGLTTAIAQNSVMGASMEQNVPNPFSQETVVKFNLPTQIVTAYMTVYDLQGKQIKTLPISERGAASITIKADQLKAGMYIYAIIADGKLVSSKRMVIADR